MNSTLKSTSVEELKDFKTVNEKQISDAESQSSSLEEARTWSTRKSLGVWLLICYSVSILLYSIIDSFKKGNTDFHI